MNRSLPIFPKEHTVLKPKEQKLIKVRAPFIDEIYRSSDYQNTRWKYIQFNAAKLKFMCNAATLDIAKNGPDTIIFK